MVDYSKDFNAVIKKRVAMEKISRVRKEGHEAAMRGRLLESNPYNPVSPYYDYWKEGWWNAEKEKQKA